MSPYKTALFAVLTVSLAIGLSLVAGETLVRVIDGYKLTSLSLVPKEARPPRAGFVNPDLRPSIDRLPTVKGVDSSWYQIDPPPPNPGAVRDPDLERRFQTARGIKFQSSYIWNREHVVREVCAGDRSFLDLEEVTVFKPLKQEPFPRYRFPVNRVLPTGLVTNEFGWRGPALDLRKPPATIRIAFVGASTTVNPHGFAFSYPEFVGGWLNLWVQHEGLPVRIEIVNAGREGTNSNDFRAVVRDELMPVEPDLVVYYEGSNQFWPVDFVDWPGGKLPPKPRTTFASGRLAQFSAMWRRVSASFDPFESGPREERVRPLKKVNWPRDLNEQDPDLSHPSLPINLPIILSDIDDIRVTLLENGGDLILSSFVWLSYDGMILEFPRHRNIYRYLNETFWPFPYLHMRRMADFQNRVFEKYARTKGLDFIDVAKHYPQDPDLFDDAIHMNQGGVRLHAWIAFNELVPLIERRLRNGELPRPRRLSLQVHPAFTAAPQLVAIDSLAAICTATKK